MQEKSDINKLADELAKAALVINNNVEKITVKHSSIWLYIAIIAMIINILMLVIIFWQRSHIDRLIDKI